MSEAKNRILLIEDEEDIVEALKMRLEGNGYEVIPALDGTDGLNKARTTAPDLIILEVMLPGIDGYSLQMKLAAEAAVASAKAATERVKTKLRIRAQKLDKAETRARLIEFANKTLVMAKKKKQQ